MSANITVNIADFTQEPLAVTKVRITPVFTHTISGASIITADRITKVTDATGIVVFENVVIGTYTAEFLGPYKITSLTFVVAESGDLNLKDLIDTPATLPDGDVAYSKAAADAKFALKTELLAYDFGTDFYVVDNDVSLSATVKATLALLTGVTSNVQDLLNTKAPLANPVFPGALTVTNNIVCGSIESGSWTPETVAVIDSNSNLQGSSTSLTELSYLTGVTSAIQTQLDTKAPLTSASLWQPQLVWAGDHTDYYIYQEELNGPVIFDGQFAFIFPPILSAGAEGSRAVVTDDQGRAASSNATATEVGYLSGVTSAIQTQLDTKATLAGTLTANRAILSDATGKLTAAAITNTQLGYLNGVTSAIQTQLDTKAPLSSPTFTGVINISGNVVSEGEINTNDLVVVGATDLQGAVNIPALFTKPQRYVSDNTNVVIVEGGHVEVNGTYNLQGNEYVQSVWPYNHIRWNESESYHEITTSSGTILYYGAFIQGSQEPLEDAWQVDQGDLPTPGFVHYLAVYDNPYTFDNIVVKNSDIIGASNVVNLAYIDNYGAGNVTKTGYPGYLIDYANSRILGDTDTYSLDASTGTITVNKAGVYKVSLQGGFATVSGDFIFQLRINGSQHSRHGFRLLTTSSAGYGTYKQIVLELNANSSLRWYLETGPNANFSNMQFMVEALR